MCLLLFVLFVARILSLHVCGGCAGIAGSEGDTPELKSSGISSKVSMSRSWSKLFSTRRFETKGRWRQVTMLRRPLTNIET